MTPQVFDWLYRPATTEVRDLARQAVAAAWDPDSVIDWSRDDGEADGRSTVERVGIGTSSDLVAGPYSAAVQRWMVSQFLHGEQGALLAAAHLVQTTPDAGLKSFAATQVADEARHVAVLTRYLTGHHGGIDAVSGAFGHLLADVVSDSRWDITALGMQILVEGSAVGSFAAARHVVMSPLANEIFGYILRDEARHVAFGMAALTERYAGLDAAERRERIELVRDAVTVLVSRYSYATLVDHIGEPPGDPTPVRSVVELLRRRSTARLRPLLRRLGLWDTSVQGAVDALVR